MLRVYPFYDALGAFTHQKLSGTLQRLYFSRFYSWKYRYVKLRLDASVAVYIFFAEEIEDFEFLVLFNSYVKQVRVVCDKSRITHTLSESRVVKYIEQKSPVGFNALDVHFVQSSLGFVYSVPEGSCPCCDLNQQTVVIRRNFGIHCGVSRVKSDAEAARTYIFGNDSCVGSKAVYRILGGKSALHRIAVLFYVCLTSDVYLVRIKAVPLRNENLRLDNIHTCCHFGNGMLHLYSRIHFDEVVIAVFIHKKFNCSRTSVIYRRGYFYRICTYSFSLLLCY